jgi:hypothetical protein
MHTGAVEQRSIGHACKADSAVAGAVCAVGHGAVCGDSEKARCWNKLKAFLRAKKNTHIHR